MKRQVNSKYGLYSKDRGLFAVQKSPLNGAKLDRLQDGRAERTHKIEIAGGCGMCGKHHRAIPWTYSRVCATMNLGAQTQRNTPAWGLGTQVGVFCAVWRPILEAVGRDRG